MDRREFVKTVVAISVGAAASKSNQSKASVENQTMIHVWYGAKQRFGHLGLPQRWINVLGRVDPDRVVNLQYTLDDAAPQPLSIGPDGHRLASPGDFNVELAFDALTAGHHTLTLIATDSDGNSAQRNVTLLRSTVSPWRGPYGSPRPPQHRPPRPYRPQSTSWGKCSQRETEALRPESSRGCATAAICPSPWHTLGKLSFFESS